MTDTFDVTQAPLAELMDDYRESYTDALNCFYGALYQTAHPHIEERFRTDLDIMTQINQELARRVNFWAKGEMHIVPRKIKPPK